MFGISVTEWMFILVVVLLFFGGKKIPELARSLGKGISEFKRGIKDVEAEISAPENNQPKLPQAQVANQQAYKFDPYTGKPVEQQPRAIE